MRLLSLSMLFAASLALGCEPPPESPAEGRAPDGELPTRSRATHVGKAVDVARVSWPDRSAVDVAARERLPVEALAAVDRSPVPVLVPPAAGLAGVARLVVKPAFYAASMRGEGPYAGLTVSVSATKISHRYADVPRVEGPSRVRGAKAFVTQNEGIWSATWHEHGVSYVLEVECAHPSEDARCASDAFVVGLAADLVFVGGSFEGGAR